jgi:hypothetical protein
LRNNSPPIEPRRVEAPTTATVLGVKNGASEAATATVVALVDGRPVLVRRGDLESDLGRAALEPPGNGESRVGEHAQHRLVLRHHLGDEGQDPRRGGGRSELLEQPRADALSLQRVCDGECDLRPSRVAQPDVVRERNHLVLPGADQRPAVVPVRIEERLDRLGPERGKAVEAPVDAPLGQRAEEGQHRLAVRRNRRTQPERPARPEDDVTDLGAGDGHDGSVGEAGRRRNRAGPDWGSVVPRTRRVANTDGSEPAPRLNGGIRMQGGPE